jgi:hypothetical protein
MSQIGALFSGLFGDAGKSFVAEQGGPDKVFGTKPQVAPFVPVDLSEEQRKALESNKLSVDDLNELLNAIYPNYSELLQVGSDNALALLHGDLPQGVQDNVFRNSAFASMMGGYAGSGMAGARTARDLGLTSLDLMERGQNSAQRWEQAALANASPFTITTMQQAGTTAANNAGQQSFLQSTYNVKAAPDPGAAGIFALDTALGQQMLSMGGAFAGAAMAGGGGSSAGASSAGSQWVGAGAAGIAAGNNYQLYSTGSGATWQYNPQSGTYQNVPKAQPVWGGGG